MGTGLRVVLPLYAAAAVMAIMLLLAMAAGQTNLRLTGRGGTASYPHMARVRLLRKRPNDELGLVITAGPRAGERL
jgi:hypothetical protein